MTQQTPAGDGLPAGDAVSDVEDPWGLTYSVTDDPGPAVVPTAAGLATARPPSTAVSHAIQPVDPVDLAPPVAPVEPAQVLAPEQPAPPTAPAPQANGWSQAWPGPGYGSTPPPPPTGGRPRRALFATLAVLIVVVAILGVTVGLSGGGSPTSAPPARHHTTTTSGTSVSSPNLEIAQSVNLAASDVPAGWAPDPASPFFSSPSSGSDSSGTTTSPADAKAAHSLETCLGIPAADDPLVAQDADPVTSQAFKQPTPASSSLTTEMQSGTAVLTPARITKDLTVITMPQFTSCFGQAMVGLFTNSSSNGGAQVGTPRISPITLEQVAGSRSVGVEISAPVTESGSSTTLDMQIVFIAGGRLETLLVGASVGQPFPLLVTARASYDIEHRIAAEGSGSGA